MPNKRIPHARRPDHARRLAPRRRDHARHRAHPRARSSLRPRPMPSRTAYRPATPPSASSDLLRLSALDAGVLGLVPGPVADVTIGHTTADVARPQPDQAKGTARYLSAQIAGITVPPALLNAQAQQTAPPPDRRPDEHSLVALDTGLLKLGVGIVEARQPAGSGPFTCARASANASLADAAVLPGRRPQPARAAPQSEQQLRRHLGQRRPPPRRPPPAPPSGSPTCVCSAAPAAAIGVKVITEPTLIGVATGSAATSYVTYTSPVLDVTLPGGIAAHLDGVHTNVDVVTPPRPERWPGCWVARAAGRIGAAAARNPARTPADRRRRDDTCRARTSVSGTAASLRVQVLLVPGDTATASWRMRSRTRLRCSTWASACCRWPRAPAARDHRRRAPRARPSARRSNPVVPTPARRLRHDVGRPEPVDVASSPVTVAAEPAADRDRGARGSSRPAS